MKKIFAILSGALCAVVMGLAVGCSSSRSATYYDITFTETDGVTYECEIKDGAEVLSGYTVRFTINIDDNIAEGDPVVKINGAAITPDSEGVYSFVMSGDTVVSVDGLINIERYNVTFDEGNTRTKYESDLGDTTEGFTVSVGEEVSFKVKKSSYYVGNMTVLANTAVLTPDPDGVYKVTVTENINVSVLGLTMEDPFYLRENTGSGTKSDPYLLSRPIDLYALSSLIAEGFYTEVPTAYYKLADDIDVEGEQLYVIGDASSQSSVFAGHFDGAGHKISNYFIDDTFIEQETYTEVFLPYLGLFGYVSASANGPAEITNLTLENFTVSVDSSVMASGNSLVGGLVGYGVGVNIIGCSVSGKIEVKAGAKENTLTYVGGVAAIIESATLSDDGAMFAGAVRSCSSAVEIDIASGNAYAVGGVVGYLRTDDSKTPAYVINSYSTQSILGGINSGGIVGITSANAAVSNCYSSALTVTAINNIRGSETHVLNHAFAGGIVGYLVGGSVITDSFSMVGRVTATAASGSDYVHYGDVFGYADGAKANHIDDPAAYAYNCYTIRDGVAFNQTFYKETLGWNQSDWDFSGTYPLINREESHVDYSVTVRQVTRVGNGTDTEFSAKRYLEPVKISDAYYPLGFLYYLGRGIDRYFFEGSRGTYGYYFDKEMTYPVPTSYVPTKDTTFYVEFVDYSAVAGQYYIGDDIYMELLGDGTLIYNNGARHYPSYYVYDGTVITMYNTLLSKLLYGELAVTEFEAYWVEKDNCLYWYDFYSLYAGTQYKANKILPKFEYGEYRSEDAQGNVCKYTFYRHGYGIYETNGEEVEFAFTASANTVNITFDSDQYTTATATLENGVITSITMEGSVAATAQKVDAFVGTWVREVGYPEKFTFDGLGGVTFDDGESHDGSYTLDGENLEITVDGQIFTCRFDGSFISVGEDRYFREYSFVGKWIYSTSVPVEIELYGIPSDGIGSATVSYNGYGDYDVRYSAVENEQGEVTLEIYYYDSVLGSLGYTADGTLNGQLYIPSQLGGSIDENARFCVYDSFGGTWVSNDDDFYVLNFNGFGRYDLAGEGSSLATRGLVSVTSKDVQGIETTASVAYTVTDADSGEFTLSGKTYTLTLSQGSLTVACEGQTVTLAPRDRLYGFELIGADGTVYAFDGRGKLTDGGEVTVTVDGDTQTSLGYTLADGTITMGDYPLIDDGEHYTWNGAELYVNNGITGEWVVGGTVDGSLAVGKIGANLSPSVTFMGDEVKDAAYDNETETLTFTWQNAVITVGVLYSYDIDESGNLVGKAVELNLNYGGTDYTCVKSDTLGSERGKYEADDGSYIYLDGLTQSIYGNGGVAMIIDGGVQKVYNYKFDNYGHVLFTDSGETYRLFVETTAGKYQNGSTHYDLVKPDYLYGRTVYRQNPDGSAGSYTYLFDGIDTVYNSAGVKLYTYVLHEQTEQDKLDLVLRLTFTDKAGTHYDVEIDYGSTEFTLRMTEITE